MVKCAHEPNALIKLKKKKIGRDPHGKVLRFSYFYNFYLVHKRHRSVFTSPFYMGNFRVY